VETRLCNAQIRSSLLFKVAGKVSVPRGRECLWETTGFWVVSRWKCQWQNRRIWLQQIAEAKTCREDPYVTSIKRSSISRCPLYGSVMQLSLDCTEVPARQCLWSFAILAWETASRHDYFVQLQMHRSYSIFRTYSCRIFELEISFNNLLYIPMSSNKISVQTWGQWKHDFAMHKLGVRSFSKLRGKSPCQEAESAFERPQGFGYCPGGDADGGTAGFASSRLQ